MIVTQRDVVLLRFPFSDLRGSKVRPALVISNESYNSKSEDFIAVAITSNLKIRGYSIFITNEDFEKGRLIVNSRIKPDKIFLANKKLVRMKIGKVRNAIHEKVVSSISDIIKLASDSTG